MTRLTASVWAIVYDRSSIKDDDVCEVSTVGSLGLKYLVYLSWCL